MLNRWRSRRELRKQRELLSVPIDFVISRDQFYTLYLMSDFELVSAFVANIDISGMAMQELIRRYNHYDITAPLFDDGVSALITIGEVS
jgi:hypothetical protein